ncbi:MAG: site-specific DNA-methyltransferase [Eubacteriales bacterium]|nr:site-specific DNA-methyltransferase [Eubacteriales bacterium]
MDYKLDGLSMDIEANECEKLKAVFPECFVEGKLDIDKLLSMCGEYITNDFEKYKFEWKGKSESLQLAQQRSSGTLRPCPDESVNFDETNNIYIKGDNLEVLKLLQTAYYRQVKMIYIDPPYNTGNDFVYEDDFADPLAKYREVTSQTTRSNPETMGRFHTNWLNMMYPRLRLAANLLRDDGVIFISIDDNEVHNLRKICDEVFGEENHLGTFIWKRRQMVDSRTKTGVSEDHEYALCYSKHGGRIRGKKPDMSKYSNPDNDPNGDWMSADMTGLATAAQRPNLHYDLINPATGITYQCPPTGWRYEKSRMSDLIQNGEVIFPEKATGRPRRKKYVKDLTGDFAGFSTVLDTVYNTQATRELRSIFNEKEYFDFPKPIELIKLLIEQGTSKENNDIILDFFSGSSTTAHAVMQLNAEDGGNRQFIMVQLPELCDEKSEAYKAGYKTICDIGMERIRRAGEKIQNENDKLKNVPMLETEEEMNLFVSAAHAKGAKGVEQVMPLFKQSDISKKIDTGFKVFELDTSNLKAWDGTPVDEEEQQTLIERMHSMIDNVKPDRTDMDMVYEIMLKMGVPLTYSVTPIDINGGSPAGRKTAYVVGDDCLLLICLAEGITPEDIEKMCDYTPGKIIFSRRCMKDDTAMANAHYILQDRHIGMKLV